MLDKLFFLTVPPPLVLSSSILPFCSVSNVSLKPSGIEILPMKVRACLDRMPAVVEGP